MAPFGGWEMPIQYRGVLDEHRACREDAVVFDVSHLGSLRVTGHGAKATLQWAFTNDLRRIEPGRAQYTHLLDERDAHVVDDIIVWWLADERFIVMPNASNTEPLVTALHDAAALVGDGERPLVQGDGELDVAAGRVRPAEGLDVRRALGGAFGEQLQRLLELLDRLEDVAVRYKGDPLAPGAIARREMLRDDLVAHIGAHPGQQLLLHSFR